MFACMSLGALKELLYQVVIRDWDTPEEKIVSEVLMFLRKGYLRVEERIPVKKAKPRRRAS